ncbi:hypothetical protein CVD25_17745 [Bacillus canaveralius]|uniref:Uncharacterized protein n=1 Tax=Bacillus canaveralius TaxID=1403243 RepID=A0A2N5GG96_9BACI|nr:MULTISPECIES: divergent polysaccharide deacetylase family protein [Bacillus]PLR79751.1 hypothetical protein CU635_21425 [Bacillus canaveralius]PLR81704.1 hypothetical protein CVD23_18175 [Bacillus sp. V33-4]PLR93161.1 hypothetical protein CVD25_17745 [Bacillus canaveralius]RSK52695.1 divergent polysaccharide deacetylase family protein [Bacillus canaveralius]
MKALFVSILLFVPYINSAATELHKEELVAEENKLAIVIDDLGNNMKGTEDIMKLPVTLTVAVMPFLPTTAEDAKMAKQYGHEVIVHLPMEPRRGKKSWLGPGAITTNLSDQEIRKRVEAAIENVPGAIGMNHHMGSKAAGDERVMGIVLEVCKEHGLYYLDSKTTGKKVIKKLADEMSIPYLENNIFFDDIYTTRHIAKQANKVAKRLDEQQQLIAIGHVGITGTKLYRVLKEYIPIYQSESEIVPVSEMIPGYDWIDKELPYDE